ncbi:hypothetical protein [Actinoplanes sp. HUAS TT8]|uniref:hypothetical protein n=1 Tax=Actinoplanes sp. HUAS TT8 TaxID=3447453 RepID=UPI003F521CFD
MSAPADVLSWPGLTGFVHDFGGLLLLAGGLLGVLLLVGLAVWAKRSGKPLRPIALSACMNLALLLNAEGMWVIATEDLHLPPLFAVLVFAVFEICFLTATSLAAEQYRNTTVYGPDGKIETPGHPGPMLWIAALIAGISGVIVASNANTLTEKMLRLAVPCVIFLMWWAALTAAGQRTRRGRFAYSPRRLAERWGWLIPDDDPDLTEMAAKRQIRRMVVNHHRAATTSGLLAGWWRSRLLKNARTAGEPVVAEVVEQLDRTRRVMALLLPSDDQPAALPIDAEIAAAITAEPVTVGISPQVAASRKHRRAVHGRRVRTLRVNHPRPVIVAAPPADPDPRTSQEIEDAIWSIANNPGDSRSHRQIAHILRTSPGRVGRVLRSRRSVDTAINGHQPELTGVPS